MFQVYIVFFRYDVPHDWPELLPALIVGIQSEDSLIQERALFTLHHVIKSLASKRLAGDRKSFQNLADQLLVPMLEVWNVHLDTTVLQVWLFFVITCIFIELTVLVSLDYLKYKCLNIVKIIIFIV